MYNLEGRLDEGNEARDMEYFMALALEFRAEDGDG